MRPWCLEIKSLSPPYTSAEEHDIQFFTRDDEPSLHPASGHRVAAFWNCGASSSRRSRSVWDCLIRNGLAAKRI
jgi:hypothetical protein